MFCLFRASSMWTVDSIWWTPLSYLPLQFGPLWLSNIPVIDLSINNWKRKKQKNIKNCCIRRLTSLCKNLFNLLEFLAEAFRCHVLHFQCLTVQDKFLHSEVNLLIQHIIVQDQDGQNNNIQKWLKRGERMTPTWLMAVDCHRG